MARRGLLRPPGLSLQAANAHVSGDQPRDSQQGAVLVHQRAYSASAGAGSSSEPMMYEQGGGE